MLFAGLGLYLIGTTYKNTLSACKAEILLNDIYRGLLEVFCCLVLLRSGAWWSLVAVQSFIAIKKKEAHCLIIGQLYVIEC